ncbi:Uncharacterised protein [Candidatus Tiddalikarchaeum anstoanum]|nr:Uncharacterised protein [Candidatus Tiddalikarchaeum anstoanum]
MSTSQVSIIKRVKTAIESFNKKELLELSLSILALAFMFALKDIVLGSLWFVSVLIYIVTVSISVFTKIITQKVVAQKFDCAVNYSISYNLLLIGLLVALLLNGSLVFAATGTIIITSAYFTRLGYKFVNLTNMERGIIALSGTITNILLALISLLLYPLSPTIFQQLININVLMAVFNMMPFPPFEGSIIFWWNRMIWVMAIIIPLFMVFFAFNLIFALIGAVLIIVISFLLWAYYFIK